MRKLRPNWWMLYALIPLLPALLIIESQIPGSSLEHHLMEFGIVLLSFGLVALWVHANEPALIEEEMTNVKWSIIYDSEQELDDLPLADCNDDAQERIPIPGLPSVVKRDN